MERIDPDDAPCMLMRADRVTPGVLMGRSEPFIVLAATRNADPLTGAVVLRLIRLWGRRTPVLEQVTLGSGLWRAVPP